MSQKQRATHLKKRASFAGKPLLKANQFCRCIKTHIFTPPVNYPVIVGKYRDHTPPPSHWYLGWLQDLYDGFKAPTFRARLEKLWQQKLKMDVRPLPRGLRGVVRLLVEDG